MIGYVSPSARPGNGSIASRKLHHVLHCSAQSGELMEVEVRDGRWRVPKRLDPDCRWRPVSWCSHCSPVRPPGVWQDRSLCNPDHWPDLPLELGLFGLLDELPDGPDPAWWFPTFGVHYERARAVCAVCPVRAECVGFAQACSEPFGMWGGLSPNERLRRAG